MMWLIRSDPLFYCTSRSIFFKIKFQTKDITSNVKYRHHHYHIIKILLLKFGIKLFESINLISCYYIINKIKFYLNVKLNIDFF